MMRGLKSVSLAFVSVLALASCTTLDSITGAGSARGTFELSTVNGVRVPTTVYQEPGYRMDVLSAAFTLEADGTYSEAGIVRETVNGQTVTRSSESYGYYDYYNGEITFDESTGRRYYGTLSANTLIINDQGVEMVYRRY
jgi:hypothetical protein